MMLTLHEVVKEFEMRPVLDGISFTIVPGKGYALTAPNGSGKTTLLQIMAGIGRPSSGSVLWNNHPLNRPARRHIGIVFQQTFLYADLTALENLTYYASLFGCVSPKHLAEEWLNRIDLVEFRNTRVRDLSKGMKQRLSLARSLIHNPSLLLLDEPFDGLDTDSSRMFRALLRDVNGKGTSIFLVTHQPTEANDMEYRYTLCGGRLEPLS